MIEGMKVYSAPIRFRDENNQYSSVINALMVPISNQVLDEVLNETWYSKIDNMINATINNYGDTLTILEKKINPFLGFSFSRGTLNQDVPYSDSTSSSNTRIKFSEWQSNPFFIEMPDGYEIKGYRQLPVNIEDDTIGKKNSGTSSLKRFNFSGKQIFSDYSTQQIDAKVNLIIGREDNNDFTTEEFILALFQKNLNYLNSQSLVNSLQIKNYYAGELVKYNNNIYQFTTNVNVTSSKDFSSLIDNNQVIEVSNLLNNFNNNFSSFNQELNNFSQKITYLYPPEFSTSTTYSIGDIIVSTSDNHIYVFNKNHPAGQWKTTDVEEKTLSEILQVHSETLQMHNENLLKHDNSIKSFNKQNITESTLSALTTLPSGYIFAYDEKLRKLTQYHPVISSDTTIGSISTIINLWDIRNDLYKHIVGKANVYDFSSTFSSFSSATAILTTNNTNNKIYKLLNTVYGTEAQSTDAFVSNCSSRIRQVTLSALDDRIQTNITSITSITNNITTLSNNINALLANFAPIYNSSSTYTTDDIFVYNCKLLKATAQITSQSDITNKTIQITVLDLLNSNTEPTT